MTENDVRVMIMMQQEIYEQKFGLPRHTQNLANFDRLFEVANKFRGAVAAVTGIIGIPALIASCIVIAKFIKGQ